MHQSARSFPRPKVTPASLALLSSVIAGAVGLMVLAGWYFALPDLLRIHPTFVAMQFNTALAFVLMAAAVIASLRGARALALGCCFLVAVLSGTGALQYLGFTSASLDGLMWYLGVDPSLQPLTVVKTSGPGRMAPNTVLCFLLGSAAAASLAALPRSRRAADLSALAGVAIGGIALLALLGYLGGAPSAYGWGGLTRMAVHTATAMVAVGIAVAALAALRMQVLGNTVIDRLPALVMVGGLVVTLGLWLAVADNEHLLRDQAVQSTATRVRDDIANQIHPRLLALARMRRRWEFRVAASRRDFENEAQINFVHFPGYRAIAWVTAGLQPAWVVADEHESIEQITSLLSDLGREAWPRVRQVHDSITFAERSGPGSGSGSLMAILPLHRNARDDGYLVGVIAVGRIVESARRDSMARGYAVRVRSGDSLLYDSGPLDWGEKPRTARVPLEADGLRWVVEVTPSRAVLASLDSRLPAIVGFVGGLVTLLLVWSLRMVQVARRRELERLTAIESAKEAQIARDRAAELAHLNQQLTEQIAERARAQREREAMQQQLSQAQKMEAVGQLAGGVAHDFNNLLTVITSYCELLLEDIPADDPRRTDVEEVLRAAGSAARLTRQLLAFSRQQILQPQAIDLNVALVEIEKMLRRLIPADIALSTSLENDLGTVIADRGQLEQVIVNLVVNARDAMPSGGRLTIQTSNVDLDDAYISRHPYGTPGAGRYVLLTVSDTGHGMDEATQARIFEPFFTTKEKGRGTGLGLSTVYGIITQSGGYVWLYSEVGRGTTFKIYLPRVERVTGTRLGAPEPRKVRGGRETVLLVEDDTAVRTIAHRILERHGYRVLQAQHGLDALRVSEELAGDIDLVVTDLVMPEMGGQELVRRLQEMRPRLKVLMMSGYTSDQTFRQRVLDEGIPFLEKPFTPSSLLATVRAVLDAEEPEGVLAL